MSASLGSRLANFANVEGGGPLADALDEAAATVDRYGRALEKIADADGCRPGHVAYLTKTAMSDIAWRALGKAAQP